MVYTIISDDMQSYDLPGKTLKIVEKIEDVLKNDARKDLSIREKYKRSNHNNTCLKYTFKQN